MLGELPKGWAESTLGEVFHWQSGGTPRRTVAQYYGGQVPWAIIGDLNDSVVESTEATLTEEGLRSSTVRWARQGAVLLAMYGSIGKLGIAGMDLTTNQAIAFTQTGIIPNKYLFFFLLAKRNELITLGKGDTQSNISQAVIKHFPFILAPLPEQRRIVVRDREAVHAPRRLHRRAEAGPGQPEALPGQRPQGRLRGQAGPHRGGACRG